MQVSAPKSVPLRPLLDISPLHINPLSLQEMQCHRCHHLIHPLSEILPVMSGGFQS